MEKISTLEFLGMWEELNNPNFNRVEFNPLFSESGKNSFTMSPSSWISPEVKLYIIKKFQRLKIQESEQIEWQGKRMLTKLNYLIHTDAIKDNLIPISLMLEQQSYVYASRV